MKTKEELTEEFFQKKQNESITLHDLFYAGYDAREAEVLQLDKNVTFWMAEASVWNKADQAHRAEIVQLKAEIEAMKHETSPEGRKEGEK